MTTDERVEMYVSLIAAERKQIRESNEKIAEWAYELEKAARERANEN